MLTANELRKKYLEFFKEKGHAVIPSASLIPENDPSSLFTTAGMQPLIPYLMGEKHPSGKRLVDVQKCIRTSDIDDVGDNRHLTFFEMLGNWSLGDYFKEDAIKWSWEFLTDPKWLDLDPKRIYVTVFKGEKGIPKDEEGIKIWQEIFKKSGITSGVSKNGEIKNGIRIIPLGKDDNFWIAGETGPCGSDTEIFYDTRPEEGAIEGEFSGLINSFRLMEIWNNVFMEYERSVWDPIKINGRIHYQAEKYDKLLQQNVDTGMGLERTITILNGFNNVFETELFTPLFEKIESLTRKPTDSKKDFYESGKAYEKNKEIFRIIADHVKAATMILGDDKAITPSNVGAGYVLRRLIRRAIRYSKKIGITHTHFTSEIADVAIKMYQDVYSEVLKNKKFIIEQLIIEEEKFRLTLEKGLKEINKLFDKYTGERKEFQLEAKVLFDLYQTYGFPVELSFEEINKKRIENGGKIIPKDVEGNFLKLFHDELKKHQDLSRTASAGMFKGGLADVGEQTTKYHTATHLLLAALREIIGPETYQKGSNITAERLRFDFNSPQKLTPEQIKQVEDLVNKKIQEKIPVELIEMPKAEALKIAKVSFDPAKYGDVVKVYKIGDYSIELCGGPHVGNTGDLGHFKIAKEEASSAGIRRIKAILE